MPNDSEEEVVEPAADLAPAPPPVRKKKESAPARAPEILPEAAPVKPVAAKKENYVHARQEVMQFEPVTRGRFEKSEPTIVEGQDLDVPTFLRKNVRVK